MSPDSQPVMLKILTIIGARPQFIKAATVSRAIAAHNAKVVSNNPYSGGHPPFAITEIIVHTGQHFDANMSDIFFEELELPEPDYHLGVSGGGHGAMTGAMLEKLEPLLQELQPDRVLVYGDTNSTLAGALAAARLNIPVAHVEAGLRSYNRRMPEEINRILTDQLSTVLFCPTDTAMRNLEAEGFPHRLGQDTKQKIVNSGDVMFDAALFYAKKARDQTDIFKTIPVTPGSYVLATVHRAENTDDPHRLRAIMDGLDATAKRLPVILPLHPRTRGALKKEALLPEKIQLINPVGYIDMVALETNAAVIATDSGGVQKEAYFHGVPCVTLRDETEWTELVDAGWNRLAPPGKTDIRDAIFSAAKTRGQDVRPYGKGHAAELIVETLSVHPRPAPCSG